ncbi:hypothetical protein KCU78_g2811, partial [Aureobasidium melanogenum]
MAPQPTEADAVAVSMDVSTPELLMDRGLTAWLQVLGSWILFMNTWGLTNSFGVFETYYNETLLTDSTSSAIAWIGSIQLFLTMIIGVFAGVLLDAGHLRLLIIVGTFFEVFGTMMTSLCTKYWQIILAQAICTGIGSGLLGLTSVAVIPLYFSSRRMIATGIAATGSSLAGIIYPMMLQHLFRSLGFPWASYALDLGVSANIAFYLLSIMNASSLLGRLLPNWLADLYGGVNVMIPACFLSATLAFTFRAVSNETGLIAVSSLYGFISGGMVSLPPAMIANLTIEKEEYGTRIGVGYTIAAFGALIGNPIAGALQLNSKSSKQSVEEHY